MFETVQGPIYILFCLLILFHRWEFLVENFFVLVRLNQSKYLYFFIKVFFSLTMLGLFDGQLLAFVKFHY